MTTPSPSARPPAWDVILADGSTARVRPVAPVDIPGITALHGRLSKETVRLRYFGAHPHLSERELSDLVEKEGLTILPSWPSVPVSSLAWPSTTVLSAAS